MLRSTGHAPDPPDPAARPLPGVAGGTTTHIAASTPGQITVVATTTQMQDLVRNVGGADVHLVGILKPNVDPHEFEPSPSDAIGIAGAKLAVTSGVGIDTWADELIGDSGSGAPVFDASAGLPIRTGDSEEPDGDPHWWHDPSLYERAAARLAGELGRSIPPTARPTPPMPAATSTELRAMDAANKRLIACRAGGQPQARDQPRRLRLLRRALRPHGGRLGDPVDLDRRGAQRPTTSPT